ncbi:hypothetical protein [Streptomyces sp. NPDC002088]|uniref:hypothetical protein n=1 Tax=Streptomyces sp. NPDC002088 TaxID=3154665 RepID=UPI00332453FF
MSAHTTSPAEWAQMGSLAVGIYGAASAVWFLTVDADLADFDPRPLARRAVKTTAQAHELLLAELDHLRVTFAGLLLAAALHLNTPHGAAR